MRYCLCVFIGLGLAVGALTGLNYSLHELLGVGTCASGGPYVSARECPDGALFYGLAIPVCIIALLVGGGIYAARGRVPGTESGGGSSIAGGIGSGLLIWSGLFLSIGVTLGLTALSGDTGPGGNSAGIIIAVIFIPMGGLPLLIALAGAVGRFRRSEGRPSTPIVPASASAGSPNPFGGDAGASTTLEGVPGSFGGGGGGGASVTPADSAAADRERTVAPDESPALPFTAAGAPPQPATPMTPPSTWPGPGGNAGAADPVGQLGRLQALREAGVLSEAEFAAAKARILDDV